MGRWSIRVLAASNVEIGVPFEALTMRVPSTVIVVEAEVTVPLADGAVVFAELAETFADVEVPLTDKVSPLVDVAVFWADAAVSLPMDTVSLPDAVVVFEDAADADVAVCLADPAVPFEVAGSELLLDSLFCCEDGEDVPAGDPVA